MSSRGYGLADRSRGTPITPDTLFDIASLGKRFTAAAIVTLAEEGRLEIRESIAQVIPGVPEDKAAITIHQLLTHTAGISDFDSEDRPVTRDELIAEFLAEPLTRSGAVPSAPTDVPLLPPRSARALGTRTAV